MAANNGALAGVGLQADGGAAHLVLFQQLGGRYVIIPADAVLLCFEHVSFTADQAEHTKGPGLGIRLFPFCLGHECGFQLRVIDQTRVRLFEPTAHVVQIRWWRHQILVGVIGARVRPPFSSNRTRRPSASAEARS